jgi:uncharacterized protein (DUF1330 family)
VARRWLGERPTVAEGGRMPKGYLFAEFEVLDAEEFEMYREKVGAVSASFGGRYVVRRSEPVVLDGEWSPKRLVIIEFDSPEQVRAFYDSSAYQAILPHRLRSTKGHVLLLTGTEQ